jgi:hypothetical protein
VTQVIATLAVVVFCLWLAFFLAVDVMQKRAAR